MDARAWRPCCHGFLAKRRRGDGGSFAIAGMWESFIKVADMAWPKTPRCLPLFSHPLKPLNAWLSFSGYLNWLRKWTLLLLDFRIHKTFKLLFWSFSSKWPKHEKHKKHDVLCSRKRFPPGKRKMIRRLVDFCGQGSSCNCVHRWYKILLLL